MRIARGGQRVSARRIAASIGWSVGLSVLVAVQGCTDTVTPAPPVPFRQRAPISNYRVPTSRPTFRWFTPHPELEHTVTICADRDCQRVEETLTVRGNSAQPGRDLPRGVHFWRVMSRWENADRVTPVWQLRTTWDTHAGVRGADRGDAADYNGDGYSDIAIMTADPNVEIVYGSESGWTSSFVNPGESPVVGRVPTILGAADLNGDGFDDLAISVPVVARDRVAVFYGGAGGLSNERREDVPSDFPQGTWFVPSILKHPRRADLDQDGIDDLLLRAGPAPDGVHYLQGNAVLWHSGGRLVVGRPDRTLPTEHPRLLLPVAHADVNGDQSPDLLGFARPVDNGGYLRCLTLPVLGPSFAEIDPWCSRYPEFSVRPLPIMPHVEPLVLCDLNDDRADDLVWRRHLNEFPPFRFETFSAAFDGPRNLGQVPGDVDVTCFREQQREYLLTLSAGTNSVRRVEFRYEGTDLIPVVANLLRAAEGLSDGCRVEYWGNLRAINLDRSANQGILYESRCEREIVVVVAFVGGSMLSVDSLVRRSGVVGSFI
jgi:hypothetical protein